MLIDGIEEVLGPYFPYTFTTDLRFVLALSVVFAPFFSTDGADAGGHVDNLKKDRPVPEVEGR